MVTHMHPTLRMYTYVRTPPYRIYRLKPFMCLSKHRAHTYSLAGRRQENNFGLQCCPQSTHSQQHERRMGEIRPNCQAWRWFSSSVSDYEFYKQHFRPMKRYVQTLLNVAKTLLRVRMYCTDAISYTVQSCDGELMNRTKIFYLRVLGASKTVLSIQA